MFLQHLLRFSCIYMKKKIRKRQECWALLFAGWFLTPLIGKSSYADRKAEIVSFLASAKKDCVSKYLPSVLLYGVVP